MRDERTFAPLGTLPAVILLLLGVPALVFGGIRALRVHRAIAGLQVAQGMIVRNELQTSPDPEGSRTPVQSYCPVVAFTPPNGPTLEFTDAAGARSTEYVVGETVRVLYDPGDPTRALLGSWSNTWQEPATYIALGLLPMVILAAWATWSLRTARRRQA